MKKRLFNNIATTILLLGGGLAALTGLVSCENFFHGENVKNEITEVIAYNNAPSVTVYIKADSKYGEFLSDGEKSFKVGYDTLVQFSLNKEDYIFEKLEAVVRTSPDTSRNEYVQFTPVESDEKKGIYKINVKVLEQISDIMIRPVCTPLPKISKTEPVLESSGCNQDTSIVFTFNKKMDPASFKDADGKIKGISITSSDGDDLTEFFGEPKFTSDNQSLHILPLCLTDDTKYILQPDGNRNAMNIEVSYNFIDVKDEDGLILTTSGIYNYKINKNFTAQKNVSIRIQNENSKYGSFLADGDKDCIVGFSFDVQFTLQKETYVFECFEAVAKDGTTSRADCVSFENLNYDEETGICSATVTIIQNNSDIIIRPKCKEISNRDIYLDGTHGKLSPGRSLQEKRIQNREYTISFDPDSDYEFLYWQIFDKSPDANGQEIANGTYITIADPTQEDTSYKLTTIPQNSSIQLAIRPVVAERPQILSNTPLYDPLGTLKDTTIQVIFDYDMNNMSIYYTGPELTEIKDTYGENSLLPPTVINGEPKYYGYKKIIEGEEEYFYKNISIKDNDNGKNLNKYFNAPNFENKRTLSITVLKEKNGKDEQGNDIYECYLKDYSQILVTLEKDFFYTETYTININSEEIEKKREVSLAGSKKWIYQVGDGTDKESPKIADAANDVKVKLTSAVINGVSQGAEILSASDAPSAAEKLVPENIIFSTDKKLNIEIKTTDTGSGPDSTFGIILQKIYDNNYSKVQTEFKDTKTIKYKIVTSQNGTYKDENGIDLEELFNLQDGVYKMNFELKDRSGNSTVYPADKGYYFAVDKTAPQIPTPSITSNNSTTYKLDWSLCTDLNTLEILYSEDGSADTTTQLEKGVKTHSLTNIVSGKAYNIRFKYTDYAGNEVESVMPKFLTGYKYEGTPNFNGENASHIPNVFFPNDKLSDYGITVKKYYSDGTSTVVSNLVPTPASYTANWNISYSCTEGQIKKTVSIPGTYYIAKEDSLTQKPVYDSSYHVRDNASDKHYKFGDFPQSVSTISSYSSVPVYNGWYLGSDGYFYEKHTANHRADLKIFANGNEITNGSVYYFKVEPIYWRALSTNYDHDQDSSTAGKTLLFADKVLKGNIPFYPSTATRTINGKTVDSNNWRYSTLRAYLNGSYESGDSQTKTYLDNGFLQKAFTTSARHLITTTKVNNNAASTNIYISSTYYNNGVNVYADSVPTDDKIFLLSLYELTNVNYKFNQAPGNSTAYSVRGRDASDYALCDNVLASPQEGWGCYYWTRSSTHQSGVVRWADTGGNVSRIGAPDCSDINGKGKGIVPALVLNTAP